MELILICCKLHLGNSEYKYINYNGISEVDNLKLFLIVDRLINENIKENRSKYKPELSNCKGSFIICRETYDELYDNKIEYINRIVSILEG